MKLSFGRWYHGWNIVLLCMIVQMAGLAISINCMTFFLDDWTREFHMPTSELVIAVPLFATVTCIFQPMVGAMLTKYAVRNLLAFALIVLFIAHTAMGFVTAGWQILAIYALLLPLAVGFSGATPSQTLVARWFVRRRGLAFSISALGLVFAGVLFPPLVVMLNAYIGWRGTWWVFAAVILLVVLPAMWLVVREKPAPHEEHLYMGAEPVQTGTPMPMLAIMRQRNFWLVLGVHTAIMVPNSGLLSNLAPFATSGGLTMAQAATILSLFNLAAAGGKILAGMFTDRFGTRPLLIGLPLAAGVSTAYIAVDHSFTAMALSFALLGASQGVWVVMAACVAEQYDPATFPRAFGLMASFTSFSSISGPVLAYAQESSGSYTIGVFVLAACGALGALCGVLYRKAPSNRPFRRNAPAPAA